MLYVLLYPNKQSWTILVPARFRKRTWWSSLARSGVGAPWRTVGNLTCSTLPVKQYSIATTTGYTKFGYPVYTGTKEQSNRLRAFPNGNSKTQMKLLPFVWGATVVRQVMNRYHSELIAAKIVFQFCVLRVLFDWWWLITEIKMQTKMYLFQINLLLQKGKLEAKKLFIKETMPWLIESAEEMMSCWCVGLAFCLGALNLIHHCLQSELTFL